MRCFKFGYLLLLLMLLSSCTRITTKQVDSRIQEAKNLLDNVRLASKNIEMKESSDAYEYIKQSEEKLEKALYGKGKQAYSDAEESRKLSLTALSKILKGGAEYSIEIAQRKEGTSSLKNVLRELNGIAHFAKGLEEGVKSCSYEELSQLIPTSTAIVRKLGEIQYATKDISKIIEDRDVRFESGRYTLSGFTGKKVLNEILKELSDKLNHFIRLYPDSKILINVTTTGYADTQPFSGNTEATLNRLCLSIPSGGDERRAALNQCLSELRAKTIGSYIEQEIKKQNPNIRIKVKFIGKGEELPDGVTPKKNPNDPRRRICIADIAVGSAE